MLRQDFAIFQTESDRGIRVEIGASLFFLAFVMIQLTQGIGIFLQDTLVFMLILASLHLREIVRGSVVELLGLKLHGVMLSGAGGRADHNRGNVEQEELIAIMGPLASFALWAAANLVLAMLPEGALARWVEIFAFINLFIAMFTIMPVQPLDGGRFFYLWLGRHVSEGFARRVMGAIGLPLAVIWLPASLLAFMIFGIVLIALPSIREHWAMLKGAPALDI